MPKPKVRGIHRAGLRVLKAISASIRLQIMTLLFERGPMSYTEIMSSLKLDATRDAGRFAYHLKSLTGADLVEPDVETKKYRLTDLGRRAIEITDDIEDRTYKRAKMLVRTSRFSIEEFDRNKIARSLIAEANVPSGLAQRIARETEKRLQQFNTKYLTAPLIREVVNAILLEKHYEEYRHNLTRLGLPVHEVSLLIRSPKPTVEAVHEAAGNSVMEEYTLLKILPRNIADAYLSGSVHLNSLGTWILKPNEINHSLSYFLRARKPKTLEAALNMTTNIVRNTSTEAIGQQNLDDFNIHIASYMRDVAPARIKELLTFFVKDLNQTTRTPTTITLKLLTERHFTYAHEAQQLAVQLLKTLSEANQKQPLRNPRIVMKSRLDALQDAETESVLHEAHELATKSILVHFANLEAENQEHATYSASGLRLADEWQKDCELDTQRTGNLDVVNINLPRIAFDARADEERFFELLDDQLELARQALEIKHQQIAKRMERDLLPYLSQQVTDDKYFKLENSTRTIAPIGLREAVQKLIGKGATEDPAETFVTTERILKHVLTYVNKHSKKPRTRLTSAIVPNETAARRFAELDKEKYGWEIVKANGNRENLYYLDIDSLLLSVKESLDLEERVHELAPGGHLALVETEHADTSAETLISMTKKLTNSNLRFFAYKLSLARCNHCKAAFSEARRTCPECGSTNILTQEHFPRQQN